MPRQPRLHALIASVAAVAATRAGRAEPQISVAATVGGGAAELRAPAPRPLFHLGLHGDVMLFRSRNGQLDAGPYVEVLTRTFETFEAGGGLSLLLPVTDAAPVILSGGPFLRGSASGWEGGVAGGLFFGSRSFNFHSAYGYALGGFAQVRAGFGPAQGLEVLGGIQMDLALLAMPFVLLFQALR